jgi:cyclic pyranopterin phosphate synthase
MLSNHFDNNGQAHMVDVSHKHETLREAVACSRVRLPPDVINNIASGKETGKGDVLAVARIAAISAAKSTATIIPLSHPLSIHHVAIEFELHAEIGQIDITATVKALERTGVEMEAMTAAAVAALTVYDMCKGHDKGIVIEHIHLQSKSGGKSGDYRRGGRP